MVVENMKKYKISLVRKFNLIVELYESTIKKISIKFEANFPKTVIREMMCKKIMMIF